MNGKKRSKEQALEPQNEINYESVNIFIDKGLLSDKFIESFKVYLTENWKFKKLEQKVKKSKFPPKHSDIRITMN